MEHLLGRQPRRYDAQAAASAGLLAGILSGTLLLAILVALDVMAGRGLTAGARAIATTFLGPTALAPGRAQAAIGVGLVAHFGLSLAFGLGFGLVAYSWQRATVVWASVVYGLLVYSFMAFVALPVANPGLARGEIGFLPAILHALFGLALGLSFEILRFRSGGLGAPRRGETVTIPPAERGPGPSGC